MYRDYQRNYGCKCGSYSNFVRDRRGLIPIKGDECNKDYKVVKVIKDYKDSRT